MVMTDDFLDDMETTVKGQVDTDMAWVGFGRDDTTAEDPTNTALDDEILDYRGDATSRYDVTDEGGDTFRYTNDDGTAPDFSGDNGKTVRVGGVAFHVNNRGDFPITAVDGGGSWFEITNASGVAEANIVSGDAEGIGLENRLQVTLAWNAGTKSWTGSVELGFADFNGYAIKEFGVFDGRELDDSLQLRDVIPVYNKSVATKLKIEFTFKLVVS